MDNIIVFRSGKFFLLHGAEEIEVENPELAVIKSNGFLRLIDRKNVFFKSTKRIVQDNEPIKWEGGFEIVEVPEEDSGRDMSGPPYSKVDFKTVCRLIAPVKEENSAMSYTEGSDYTLSRESDEPGIQLNTNISTSPVPSENSKPRESETIEAWKAWEDDQRTNPTPVNPHAFAYGYNIAKNKYSQPVPSEQEKQEEIWIDVSNVFTVAGHGDAAMKHLERTYYITRK